MRVFRFGCLEVPDSRYVEGRAQVGSRTLPLTAWTAGWGLGGASMGGWPGGLLGMMLGWMSGLAWLAWAGRYQKTQEWKRWSLRFRASAPAQMNAVGHWATEASLFHAGLRLGTQLLQGQVPEVPRHEHPAEADPRRRLIGWVSQQCFRAPTAFHRGLWASLERDPSTDSRGSGR